MAIYLQHGFGKSDKIEEALENGTVQGVVLAPRNEKPEKLASCVQSLIDRQDCEVLIDPQFYISTFAPAKVGYLPEYSYFHGGLSAGDFSMRRIRQYVEEVLAFQAELGGTAMIAPTVLFDSFNDRWYQIALNLADAALEIHAGLDAPPPLLLSFAMAEESLSAEEEVNSFLDTVTQDGWGMQGFYLVVARNESSYNQDWDGSRLANLLYLVHVLGHINETRVVMGYTDFLGVALRAAGASAFATGWSQGLRQFVRKNFLERPPGGQPPRLRYSSGPLLNSIFLQELQEIYEVGKLEDVLSGVELDSVITEAESPLAATWNQNISQHHHWQTLNSLDQAITGNVRRNVLSVLGKVREARALYASLAREGVELKGFSGPGHLPNWGRALTEFARRAGFAPS